MELAAALLELLLWSGFQQRNLLANFQISRRCFDGRTAYRVGDVPVLVQTKQLSLSKFCNFSFNLSISRGSYSEVAPNKGLATRTSTTWPPVFLLTLFMPSACPSAGNGHKNSTIIP